MWLERGKEGEKDRFGERERNKPEASRAGKAQNIKQNRMKVSLESQQNNKL